MRNEKASALPLAELPLQGDEVVPGAQNGRSVSFLVSGFGGGSVAWADITGKPATFPPEAHTQAISTVIGLQTALDGKQPLATVLTNTTAAFTTTQETKLAGVATGATANSPDATLLARANHTGTQAAATITGLATVATTGAYGDLTGIPATFAPSSHSHVISDVTGLQAALDAKQATLVSGTNIKSVNGESLLGAGDIVISGGGGGTPAVTATRVRRSTNQSIPTGTGWTDLVWDAAAYQAGGSFWTSGAIVTIPVDGYYRVFSEATLDGAGIIIDVTADLQILAGASVIGSDHRTVPPGETDHLAAETTRFFTAGTQLKVQVRHSMGTAVNVITQGDIAPEISVFRLGGQAPNPKGVATVTVPDAIEHIETVAAIGVSPDNVIMLSLAPHDDADENDPEMLDIRAVSARALTDQIAITANFGARTSGPVKFNWSAF